MGEHEETHLTAYPYISTEEVMMRLGVNEGSSFYASPEKSRAAIGLELDRAEHWVKARTGWDFGETEDISDNQKSIIADCVTQRVAHFFYQRMAMIRIEVGEHFRIMSNRANEEAVRLVRMLQKDEPYSDILTYPKDSRMGRISEE